MAAFGCVVKRALTYSGCLDERRATKEDGAVALHNNRLVRHGGHVGAARSAAAHHHGDLIDGVS